MKSWFTEIPLNLTFRASLELTSPHGKLIEYMKLAKRYRPCHLLTPWRILTEKWVITFPSNKYFSAVELPQKKKKKKKHFPIIKQTFINLKIEMLFFVLDQFVILRYDVDLLLNDVIFANEFSTPPQNNACRN